MSNPFLKKKILPTTETHPLSAPSKPKVERPRELPKRSQELAELQVKVAQLERVTDDLLEGLKTVVEQKIASQQQPPLQALSLETLVKLLQADTSTSELVSYLKKTLIEDAQASTTVGGKYRQYLRARKIAMSIIDYLNSQKETHL